MGLGDPSVFKTPLFVSFDVGSSLMFYGCLCGGFSHWAVLSLREANMSLHILFFFVLLAEKSTYSSRSFKNVQRLIHRFMILPL